MFLAVEENIVSTWVLRKGEVVHLTEKEIEIGCSSEDAASLLMETTFKETGVGVGARCENRSLDDLPCDLPSERGNDKEVVVSSQCTNNSLKPLYDTMLGPTEHLLQGDELIIMPNGPLCLTPYTALSESIRFRIIPSLTSLQIIRDSPEGYHSKGGALLVGDPCLAKVTNKRGKPIYTPIKYAKKEVKLVGEILKTSPVMGEEATKNEVLKRITSVELVHIATHGRMETGEIALAPDPGLKFKIKEEHYILKISDFKL